MWSEVGSKMDKNSSKNSVWWHLWHGHVAFLCKTLHAHHPYSQLLLNTDEGARESTLSLRQPALFQVWNKTIARRGCCQLSVRATLPPSTLFADRALLHRGYSISEPNAWGETVSKPLGCHQMLFLLVFSVHFWPNFTPHSLPTFPLHAYLPYVYLFMTFTLTNKRQEQP